MSSSQKGWLNAIIFIGMMVGGFLFGGAADVKGRRYILLWSMTINGLFGLLSGFAPNYGTFVFFRLLSGIGVGAAMPVIFTYCAEFTATEKRGPVIAFTAAFWIMGNILTCLLAWVVIPRINLSVKLTFIVFSSWRIFVVLGALPSLSSALIMYLLPESPMFLTQKGHYEEAHRVFLQMHKHNYGALVEPPDELTQFYDYYVNTEPPRCKKSSEVDDPELCLFGRHMLEIIRTLSKILRSAVRLFRGQLRGTTIMLIIIWVTLSFGYYGLWMWLPEIFKRAEAGDDTGCTSIKPTLNGTTMHNLTCQQQLTRNTALYVESLVIAISNIPGM